MVMPEKKSAIIGRGWSDYGHEDDVNKVDKEESRRKQINLETMRNSHMLDGTPNKG